MKKQITILLLLINTVIFAQEADNNIQKNDSLQISVTELKFYRAKADSLMKLNPYVVITYKSSGSFSESAIEIEGKKVPAKIESMIPVFEWKTPEYTDEQLYDFIRQEIFRKNTKK